jgi:HAD superfamily hydrolase (TIGR01459 family)
MDAALPPVIAHFAALAADYDVLLCDVWGVVHNGLTAHPQACDALMRVRARGAAVILITNAPRPGEAVARQLDRLHVPREAYDGIVSSGDVTRGVIEQRPGQSLCHLGPERDLSIFKGLGLHFAPAESADYAVCTGLANDEVETPDDYRGPLETMLARKLLMVCGNPDVVVERGSMLVYCAGAIADLYATMGGEVLYAGKPYRPIYDLALAKAELGLGRKVAPRRVLAIGDSVRTDLKGAHGIGVDFLFVTAGIHAEELGGRERPDARALREIFAAAGEMPKAVMRQLVW